MALQLKPIINWKNIFLDTSIVISLFLSETPRCTDEKALFVRKLIDYLNEQGTGDRNERTFQISVITLTEILSRENDREKIRKILFTLNSENVEFLDFDLRTSLQFNAHLYRYLTKKSLHRMAASFGFKSNEFMMAREWISRDFMIIESAISANSDIILSCDEKTFVPICNELNAPCAVVDPTRFDHSEKFIKGYLG